MIHPSTFLSRALLADAIFSGVSAVGLTLGAGALAPLPQSAGSAAAGDRAVPDRLYRAGRLARHAVIGAEGAGVARHRRQCGVDARQHRAAVLGRGVPNLLGQIVVVAQAIATGVFAELQYIGLRKSGGVVTA